MTISITKILTMKGRIVFSVYAEETDNFVECEFEEIEKFLHRYMEEYDITNMKKLPENIKVEIDHGEFIELFGEPEG